MSSTPSLYIKQLGLGAASPLSGRHLLLLLLGAGFLAFTVFVFYPNEFRIQSFSGGSCSRSVPDAASTKPVEANDSVVPHASTSTGTDGTQIPAAEAEEVRLLIGIQTLPSKYERRHLLRTVYSLQVEEHPSLALSVDVRFVFCNVTSPDDAVLVALEIMRFGDIIVLDCAENMDNGKTYTFFSTVARTFNNGTGTGQHPRYDYVMKADDDTYLRLPALVSSLRGASREDAYYGLQMPCDTENFYPFPPFMSGMGYALSWDLVRWVATSELSRRDRVGPEDMWTGRWLNLAGKAKHRYDMAPRMYNYKGSSPDSCFRHGFIPDTIAVHMLKDDARWAETLGYFNATARLPPRSGGLYHLPLPGRP